MVPFNLTIELQNIPCDMQVEQLDRLADENGFIRYDVRTENRRAVISVPVDEPLNPGDINFDAVQAIDEAFSDEEMVAIMKAIQDYNRELAVHFKRFMNRN